MLIRLVFGLMIFGLFAIDAFADNKAPAWAKGAFVYRVSTPDEKNALGGVESGIKITSNLLDGSVKQIFFLNGIIGHDHPGICNWDGLWPYWNRVTYRANNDWGYLSDFMLRTRDKYNGYASFHVNLTDVNVGLADYPESREFFKKLVETKSIYKREWNPKSQKRDIEPPIVPQEIQKGENPVQIFALVNYQNFWKSGLAKQMIDEFYGKLPYAPPLLYLDVLTLNGGNFSTGYPDGPLGGSKETQAEGRRAIVDYLRSKGTDTATEGSGTMREINSSYAWLHGQGISDDDYSHITGGYFIPYAEQTYGSMGGFNVSPIASTRENLNKVRSHYKQLLAGKTSDKIMPDLSTTHICRRTKSDEYDIPGTGDPYRGDWADLVNNFYLINIQELYHIGKGNTRTLRYSKPGIAHLRQFTLVDADNKVQQSIEIADFLPEGSYQKRNATASRDFMLENPLKAVITPKKSGKYQLKMEYFSPSAAAMNIYINDKLLKTIDPLPVTKRPYEIFDIGEIEITDEKFTISIDAGPIRAEWSDGTKAVWKTPYTGTGFSVTNGDVTYARDYDRMWPDTWSGQKKVYFYSWYGCDSTWKLPPDWSKIDKAVIYPLTPDGRGKGMNIKIAERTITPKLLPQVPYVLVVDK